MSQKEKPGVHLFNTVYHPIHDIKEICETMCDVINVKYPSYTIPSTILIFIAFLISKLGKLLGKNFGGINPDRVKKLMISTNINGEKLKNQNYFLSYDLQSALDDWYADCDRLELK